tara:strand:- start:21886 stop:22212 length:327 start_codon:yes stop_codon:yes gene_type:complete
MFKVSDLENDCVSDEVAEYDLKLEEEHKALSDDLYEAYFDDNDQVVEAVEDQLTQQEDFYKRLRENHTGNGVALKNAHSKAIAIACDVIAACCDSLAEVERVRREWDV